VSLTLVGIVLRGSAFAFRSGERNGLGRQQGWHRVFSIASLLTPVLLGVTAGAIASGNVRVEEGRAMTGFITPWFALFPFSVGFFTLALFVYLAATYLILETEDVPLREDFRRRGLFCALVVAIMAVLVFLLSREGAPTIFLALTTSWWAFPLVLMAGASAAGAILALWKRRFRTARVCAILEVTLILWGWAFAQFPYLVEPLLTIHNAAAPELTLRLVLLALLLGAVVLFPSLFYLLRVFKTRGSSRNEEPGPIKKPPPGA
jgi:cytochrome d ubiquinol oxidase subunit II